MVEIVLRSNDEHDFTVDYEVAMRIPVIAKIIESSGIPENPLELGTAKPELSELIEYATLLKTMEERLEGLEERIQEEKDVENREEWARLMGEKKMAERVNEREKDNFEQRYQKLNNSDLSLLITAANLNGMIELLNTLCAEVARRLKGKTAEEIRKEFNIPSRDDVVAEFDPTLLKLYNKVEAKTALTREEFVVLKGYITDEDFRALASEKVRPALIYNQVLFNMGFPPKIITIFEKTTDALTDADQTVLLDYINGNPALLEEFGSIMAGEKDTSGKVIVLREGQTRRPLARKLSPNELVGLILRVRGNFDNDMLDTVTKIRNSYHIHEIEQMILFRFVDDAQYISLTEGHLADVTAADLVRRILNNKNVFTVQQEEQVKKENSMLARE